MAVLRILQVIQVAFIGSTTGFTPDRNQQFPYNLATRPTQRASAQITQRSPSVIYSVLSHTDAPGPPAVPPSDLEPLRGSTVSSRGDFNLVEVTRKDLEPAAELCVQVFFGNDTSWWKQSQLRRLYAEQLLDLTDKFNRPSKSILFKVTEMDATGEIIIGFAELSMCRGLRVCSTLPVLDERPVLSNLAVRENRRRRGIGSLLMQECENAAQRWGFTEVVLQVEEDNREARALYQALGYRELFTDRTARRYDTSGFFLRNVRTAKTTLSKPLDAVEL